MLHFKHIFSLSLQLHTTSCRYLSTVFEVPTILRYLKCTFMLLYASTPLHFKGKYCTFTFIVIYFTCYVTFQAQKHDKLRKYNTLLRIK